jgi:hypothetical protein
MQRLGPAQQPFELSDGILAFCLYLAGVPFLTTRNSYTADTFRKLGFKGEIDLIEAAKECVATNRKGDLKYLFGKSPELRGLLKIFSDQQARLQSDQGEAREVVRELMSSYAAAKISLEEAMMRIACIILKLRSPFLNRWKELPPLVVVHDSGRERRFKTSATVQTKSGSKSVPAEGVQYPGFKVVSANASEKTKKRLGLM